MLATLTHIADLRLYSTEKPYKFYSFSGTETNCEYVEEAVIVEDVRGRESEFRLDGCGFAYINRPCHCLPTAGQFEAAGAGDEAVTTFLKETMAFVKEYFNATRVLCIDWRLRKNTSTAATVIKSGVTEDIRKQALMPVANMHCDYSNAGGLARLKRHLLPTELSEIAARRDHVRFINAWRPLEKVEDAPLVLCDRRTVAADDLLPVDQVVQNSVVEEGLLLKHRSQHRWYWYSQQSPDHVALFCTWDSLADNSAANYSPHGASLKAPVVETAAPRQSVEVRLIVVTPGES